MKTHKFTRVKYIKDDLNLVLINIDFDIKVILEFI